MVPSIVSPTAAMVTEADPEAKAEAGEAAAVSTTTPAIAQTARTVIRMPNNLARGTQTVALEPADETIVP